MATFAEKLKALMGEARMTQGDLAELLRTQQSTISRWATSKSIPDIDQGLKLAEIFNVPMEFLADDRYADAADVSLSLEERAILKVERKIGFKRLFLPETSHGDDELKYEDYLARLRSEFMSVFMELATTREERKRTARREHGAAWRTRAAEGEEAEPADEASDMEFAAGETKTKPIKGRKGAS